MSSWQLPALRIGAEAHRARRHGRRADRLEPFEPLEPQAAAIAHSPRRPPPSDRPLELEMADAR
ncbi:hypothetical protein RSP822_23845 [Ralstonia solanacearum]|nr:hypothetical protein RSP822_23845 [Ralstonia solanacearum]